MKLSSFLGAGLLALATAATYAQADQPPERKAGDLPGPIDSLQDLQDIGKMIFKVADANNDGQISQPEVINAANVFVGGFFFNADKNGDGVLSKDEVRQAREEFLSQKPWLRYVIETAETTPKASPGQPAPNGAPPAATGANANPLMGIASTFDTNNDGQLQAAELRQAVQTVVQSVFASADANRDNQLSPTEVNAALSGIARTVAQSAFQSADSDGNGQISEAEFEKAIVQPARVAFRIMDLNHDGQISPQEVQTARQVVMSKLRLLNMPEAPNSPRNMINSAIGNPTQPSAPPAITTPTAAATPAPNASR